MAKAKIVADSEGRFYAIRVICPACSAMHVGGWHVLETEWMPAGSERTPGARPDRWGFNGDLDRPTFSPSLLITTQLSTPPVTPENIEQWKAQPWEQTRVPHVCHSFIRDGRIEYLGDCTHALAGQTVDLPEIDGE